MHNSLENHHSDYDVVKPRWGERYPDCEQSAIPNMRENFSLERVVDDALLYIRQVFIGI